MPTLRRKNRNAIVDDLFGFAAFLLAQIAFYALAQMCNLSGRTPRPAAIDGAAQMNLNLAKVLAGVLPRLAIGQRRAFRGHHDAGDAIPRKPILSRSEQNCLLQAGRGKQGPSHNHQAGPGKH
jgi:hypothetical protein